MSDYYYLKNNQNEYLEIVKDQYIGLGVKFLYAFVTSENYSISSFDRHEEGDKVKAICEKWFPQNCHKDTYLTCTLIKSQSQKLNSLSEKYLIEQKDVSLLEIQNLPQKAQDILFLKSFLDKVASKKETKDKDFNKWIDEVNQSIQIKWDRVNNCFAFLDQEFMHLYEQIQNGDFKVCHYTQNQDLQKPFTKYGMYSQKGFVSFDFDQKTLSNSIMLENATLFSSPEQAKKVGGIMGSYVIFSVTTGEHTNNLKIVSISEFQSEETRNFIAQVERLDIKNSSLPKMKELVNNTEEALLSSKSISPIKTL